MSSAGAAAAVPSGFAPASCARAPAALIDINPNTLIQTRIRVPDFTFAQYRFIRKPFVIGVDTVCRPRVFKALSLIHFGDHQIDWWPLAQSPVAVNDLCKAEEAASPPRQTDTIFKPSTKLPAQTGRDWSGYRAKGMTVKERNLRTSP
jgi:hypothetical protein